MVKRYRYGCKGRAWDGPDMRVILCGGYAYISQHVVYCLPLLSFTSCDEETHSSVAVSETDSLAAFGESARPV